jgi:hypothetical protein
VAAVLHCEEHGLAGRIIGPTSAAAIRIARYPIPHAEAVLNMMQAKEELRDDDARYVLRWIERHGRREFTKRDVQQHGKRRFPKADQIAPAVHRRPRMTLIRRTSQTRNPKCVPIIPTIRLRVRNAVILRVSGALWSDRKTKAARS